MATVTPFIGHLPQEGTEQAIQYKQQQKPQNYGFVHTGDQVAAEDAIHNKLHRVNITVEAKKSKASAKLHIGNIGPTCTNQELWARLEEHGSVIECDVMKDYAFVHVERAEDAVGLSGALTAQSLKAHEHTCSCPPASFGLPLG
uniref:RRM domain-containing protein n=1 Tax=Phocoena sinus TaxID=42100 RepID=A0A8C9CV57_PHOSS